MYQNEKQNAPRSQKLWLFLFASIVLHLCVLISQFAPFGRFEKKEEEPVIEVTQLTPQQIEQLMKQVPPQIAPKKLPPSREKEIAESEDAKNREVDPEAKYLSDKNQKVEQQMRAKDIDDFRKKELDGKNKGQKAEREMNPPTGDNETAKAEEKSFEEEAQSEVDLTENRALVPDSKNRGIKRDWKTLNLKDLGVGGNGVSAATDDRLQGVDNGDRTILSTREFKFFSYYHRIKELLRQHWKPNVERRLTRMYEKGKNVREDEMITRLQVLLSPEGKIAKISRVTSSGIEEIDDAAIEAFNRASPFPNPPKGMLDPDGFVRINWDFILKTEAAPRIQFSNAGRPIP